MSGMIADLVAQYPCIRIAGPEQGAEISAFLRAQMIEIPDFSVGFDRGPDFFSLLRAYGGQYWAFTFHNEDGSLVGVASLSRHWLKLGGGAEQPVGYFGDLRMNRAAGKRVRVAWRNFYADLVAHLENPLTREHCHAIFTAVLDGNAQGLNAFTRGLKGVVYHELQPYTNLAIFHPLRNFFLLPRKPDAAARIRGKIVDLGASRTLLLQNPRWSQRLFACLIAFLKLDWQRCQIERPFRIRAITALEEAGEKTQPAKLRGYVELVRTAFAARGEKFDFTLFTSCDQELCEKLGRIFPLAYAIRGKLFEVTSTQRAPCLRAGDIRFEGAYL